MAYEDDPGEYCVGGILCCLCVDGMNFAQTKFGDGNSSVTSGQSDLTQRLELLVEE